MKPLPRIKVCGITRRQDALAAADLGVDALGFVFYEKSPRCISPHTAADMIAALPPFITTVGLFVNPDQADIDATLRACPLDVLQLHGDESPAFCAAQQRRVIKAIPVSTAHDLKQAAAYDCTVLLDARAPEGVYGGTGTRFDWTLLQAFTHPCPIILAGGLDAGNVAAALGVRQFYGVDVSSGIERSPGIKDAEKMSRFVASVRQAVRET